MTGTSIGSHESVREWVKQVSGEWEGSVSVQDVLRVRRAALLRLPLCTHLVVELEGDLVAHEGVVLELHLVRVRVRVESGFGLGWGCWLGSGFGLGWGCSRGAPCRRRASGTPP